LRQAHDEPAVAYAHAQLAGVDHLLQLLGHVAEDLHALGGVALPLAQLLELLARGAEVALRLGERGFRLVGARLEGVAVLLAFGREAPKAGPPLPRVVPPRARARCGQHGPKPQLPPDLDWSIVVHGRPS